MTRPDPMDRLRAADPVPRRPAVPPVAELLDRIDADESATAATRPAATTGGGRPRTLGRRRALRIGGAVAVGCAIATAGAVTLTGTGGGRLDVVAQARAALAPHGEILYLTTRSERRHGITGFVVYDHNRRIGRLSPRREQWSTGDPLRYRTRQRLTPFRGSPGGTVETDFADGTLRQGQSWGDEIVAQRLPKVLADQLATVTRAVNGIAEGDDPIQRIRELLDSGDLRPAGETSFRGRRVLRLVGRRAPDPARRIAGSTVEYLVDPGTYRPRQMTTRTQALSDPRSSRRARSPLPAISVTDRTVFEQYRRIPLTDRTAKVLRLSDTAGKRQVRAPDWGRRVSGGVPQATRATGPAPRRADAKPAAP